MAFSFFMNRFRDLGSISYHGRIQVHESLLNEVLLDQLPEHNAEKPLVSPCMSFSRLADSADVWADQSMLVRSRRAGCGPGSDGPQLLEPERLLKHERQSTALPCLGMKGTVVSEPHAAHAIPNCGRALRWTPPRFALHPLHRFGSFVKLFSKKKSCSPAVKTKSVEQSVHRNTLSVNCKAEPPNGVSPRDKDKSTKASPSEEAFSGPGKWKRCHQRALKWTCCQIRGLNI